MVKIELAILRFHHHSTCSVAEELVKYDPPVVGWELEPLELLCLGSIDKRRLLGLAFDGHSVGNDHILEPILLADVVVLVQIISTQTSITSIVMGESIHIWQIDSRKNNT